MGRGEKKRRNLQTKISPIAEDSDKAVMNEKQAITSDRMFLGAFVNAYSRPVIEANISLMAIRMYLI